MELPISVEEQAKRTALKDEMDKMRIELRRSGRGNSPQTRQADLLKQANELIRLKRSSPAKSDGGEELSFSMIAGRGKSDPPLTHPSAAQAGTLPVQLETLLHDSLPSQGPGRNYTNANFNFESQLNFIWTRDRSLAFVRSRADFSKVIQTRAFV